MKLFSIPINRFTSSIIPIFAILIILYYSGSIYSVFSNSVFLTYGLYILTGSIFVISILVKNIDKNRSNIKIFLVAVYFIIMYLVTILVNNDLKYFRLYSNYIIFIVFAISIVRLISFQRFAKFFVYVVFSISLISLVNYVIYNYTDLIKSTELITSDNNVIYAKTYLGYIYYGNPLRNIGYFWEPGVYSSILGLALLFNILILKNKVLITLILSISIITTNSASGLIVLFLVSLVLFRKIINEKNIKLLVLLTIAIVYIVHLLINNSDFTVNSLNKILNFSLNDARIMSFIYNYEIFKSNFLFGVGYGRLSEIFVLGIQNGIVVAQTSTIMMYLAASGIFGIGYTIIWLYGILNFKLFSKRERIVVAILMVFILNKEPHISILLTNILMIYFIQNFKQI